MVDLNTIYSTTFKGLDIVNRLKKIPTLESNLNALISKVEGKQDTIVDLETIRSNSQKGGTAVQPSGIFDMATKEYVSLTYQRKGNYALKTDIPDVSNKADKSNTLEGYGITDAFTKEEIRQLFANFTPSEGGGSTPGTGFEPFDDTLIWNAINGKQDIISDLQQIRANASNANIEVNKLSIKVKDLEDRPSNEVYDDTEIRRILAEIPNLYRTIADSYNKLQVDTKILQAAVGTIDKVGGYVTEDGFFVTDAEGNVMFKVDNDGIDFAEITQHAIDLLVAKGIGKGGGTTYQSIAEVAEDGFFIVDGNNNIGAMFTPSRIEGLGGGSSDNNTIYQQASDKVYNINI